MIDHREEQIKLLSKQLKLPTFANYTDILRQAKPNADFSDLLLDLLMTEANARQENQNRRRLKAAAFVPARTWMRRRSPMRKSKRYAPATRESKRRWIWMWT